MRFFLCSLDLFCFSSFVFFFLIQFTFLVFLYIFCIIPLPFFLSNDESRLRHSFTDRVTIVFFQSFHFISPPILIFTPLMFVRISITSNLARALNAIVARIYSHPTLSQISQGNLLCLVQVSFHFRGHAFILSFLLCLSFLLNTGPELGTVKFRSTRSCVLVLSFFIVITASPPSMRLLLSLDSCSFCGLLLN